MTLKILFSGPSRSFPTGDAELAKAVVDGDALILLGASPAALLAEWDDAQAYTFVAVELGTECLAEHTGLGATARSARTVGFARFRLGEAQPTQLIELVKQSSTSAQSVAAAKAAFESAGFVVAVCGDFPGRIVDRLIRPYLNAVLRRFDEGLASADDLDMTLRLGLGYPEGPLALLERTGLAHHFDVTVALHSALGGDDLLPARRARIAKTIASRH